MSAARTISSLSFLVAIAAASIGVLPARAHVITCDHLKTALVASAFEHHLQTPVARSEQVSPSNPDDVAWMISFEGLSQPVAMICHSDYVASFAADTRELNSSTRNQS